MSTAREFYKRSIERNRSLFRLRFRFVNRYSKDEKLLRLFRLTWCRGRGPGVGGRDNYSAKLSAGVEFDSHRLTVGISRQKQQREKIILLSIPFVSLRLHYKRDHGGILE